MHLIYPRLLTWFCMLVLFTNLSLMEFQVKYLALFFLFSLIYSFEWFWMESLHKNIQLMLEFFKTPFLVLYFSCYTLMAFMMMLFVILISMLMIQLSVLSVIWHLICGNKKKTNKQKLYGPFLWMGFNCLKASATSRRQFTFYH